MTHQWIDELIIINLVVLIMMMMMINGSNGQTSTNPMTQQWPLRFHRSPNWLQKEFIIPSEPSTNEVNGNNCDDGNNIDDISNQMSECQAKRECTYAPSMHCAQRMRTVRFENANEDGMSLNYLLGLYESGEADYPSLRYCII